jgi:DNA-directed RNA polymerase subunit RPC12/RpoP
MPNEEKKQDSVECRHCGNRMRLLTVKRYPGNWPWILIAAGVFLSCFLIGAGVGLPILLVGIYMATATVTVNRCGKCGYYYKVLPG